MPRVENREENFNNNLLNCFTGHIKVYRPTLENGIYITFTTNTYRPNSLPVTKKHDTFSLKLTQLFGEEQVYLHRPTCYPPDSRRHECPQFMSNVPT